MSTPSSEPQNNHGSGHSHDWAEANRQFFDKTARDHDTKPFMEEYTKTVVKALEDNLILKKGETTVLDYACGTGRVSQSLYPSVKKVVGVDISQLSVDRYNEEVEKKGIAREEIQALCIKLEGKESELDGQKFDVAICIMAYHHFDDIEAVTRTLAYFLKPGGVLAIVDLVAAPVGELSLFQGRPDVHHVVPHKSGFTEDNIEKVFVTGAGLQNFKYKPVLDLRVHEEATKKCFIAHGEKPSTVLSTEV